MTEAAAPRSTRLGIWAFIALMLGLTGLFLALGWWQVQRLEEKELLLATIEDRLDLQPVPLPPVSEWSAFDPEIYDYRPITVTGRYRPEATVLVFTSRERGPGLIGGAGYLVVTLLALDDGGSIFVNRGFVPQASAPAFAAGGPVEPGVITLTGLGRVSQPATSFTPGSDFAHRIEWVRNVDRLAAFTEPALGPFAPITLDLPAGPPGALPAGGGTVVALSNNHLGYAITWFGFAAITPILLFFWVRRQRHGRKAETLR